MDLSKMSAVDLKALAYDILVQRENLDVQLRQVNNFIAERIREAGNGKRKTIEAAGDKRVPKGKAETAE